MDKSPSQNIDSESVVYQVVRKIADKEGSTVEEIQPLHESVDAQALEDLFSHSDSEIRVDFNHHGQRVIVVKDSDLKVKVI